ncbi:Flp pilus assembly protein CpaB [Limnobacter sp.]|uniref:Flp pilus assembly protein CpaB n=1 Tax=Limnobacter sp. TaxID=2003368 RepID=UPI002588C546|nr:Flp pilus assembly protein CpaB [Limnobacter sp.]
MSGKTKIIALILLAVGLVFMAMSFLSGQKVQKSSQAVKTEVERKPVVVSSVAIKFGEPIKADQVRIDKFAIAPEGTFKSVEEVLGKKALFNIPAGSPITKSFFEAGAVAQEVREGYRAFAVKLDDNNVTTDKIKAGDFVDVFSMFKSNNTEVKQTVSRMVLPKLRVLAVGDQLVNTPDAAQDTNNPNDPNNRNKPQKRAITVEVPVAEVNTIAVAQNEGSLYLVIRNPDDLAMPDTSKYPAPTTVLQPVKQKVATVKGIKMEPIPDSELTDEDRAYAGTSLGDVVLPGSQKKEEKKQTVRAAASSSTVEVIRGGEVSRERAK